MNNKINTFLLYILGTASIMPLATTTHAGQIYMYKDSNGSTLLTNRKSADRSLTKVKVTYYPDSNIHVIATGAILKHRYCQVIAAIKMPLTTLFSKQH